MAGEGGRLVIVDTFALLFMKGGFVGLRLFLLFLISQATVPGTFGALALTYTTAEVSRYVFDWGGDIWSLRTLAHHDSYVAESRFWWLFRYRAIVATPALIASFCFGSLVSPELDLSLVFCISCTAVTGSFSNLFVNWSQARRAVLTPAAFASPVLILGIIFLIVALWSGWGVLRLVLSGLAIELFFIIVIFIVISSQLNMRDPPKESEFSCRSWLWTLSPIAATTLVGLIYSRFDLYYLKSALSPAEFGSYALAQRIVEPFLFVLVALSSILHSRAARYAADSACLARIGYWQYSIAWIKRILLFYSTVIIVSYTLIELYFPIKKGWVGFDVIVPLAMVCALLKGVNMCVSAFIQALGAYTVMMRLSIFNACLIISLVLLLTRQMGVVGALFAIIIGEAVNSCLQILILKTSCRGLGVVK